MKTKEATLNLKVEPELKAALQKIADGVGYKLSHLCRGILANQAVFLKEENGHNNFSDLEIGQFKYKMEDLI